MIPEAHLNYPGRVDDAVTASTGNAKRGASDITIYMAEGVAVERVRNIQLEYEDMRFKKRCPFDDGKVLVDETRISDVAERLRHIPKRKAVLLKQSGVRIILIEKRSAIEEVIRRDGRVGSRWSTRGI